jgi:hypothetical protein
LKTQSWSNRQAAVFDWQHPRLDPLEIALGDHVSQPKPEATRDNFSKSKKMVGNFVEILGVLISHVYHVCIHTSDGALVKMIERGFFNKSGEGHAAVAKQVSLHGAPISQSH